MTGRGSGRLIRTSDNPSVTIGITLSASPSSMSLTSQEPFYIVVTARILSTPYPEKSITLRTDPTPLEDLSNHSFRDIKCTTDPSKKIVISPFGHLFPRDIDTEDLRKHFPFVMIPPKDQGVYSIRHEVLRNKIEAADIQKGERYTVSLTDKCLGTRWWTFASLEDLEGVRFAQWQSQIDADAGGKFDPELTKEIKEEKEQKHGDMPVTMGEQPSMLAMVPEVGQVEFEVF
ncbi:hypothetical protein EV356DRAFT_566529 [Viridothelium virens]|uniref:Uncharacterized protein n=1 Tax=Viridothelium virens TaxID=1048519 RepID=A0A6A6HBH0_VIRVR|nr:hypothetical protein EV356DRAFT_566529 [Viridothelium virens]